MPHEPSSDLELLKRNITKPEDLLALPDLVFRDLVDEDLRLRGPERTGWLIGDFLRDPKVVNRFYTDLIRKSKSIEGQLASNSSALAAREEHLRGKLSITNSQLERAEAGGDPVEIAKCKSKVVNQTAEIHSERSKSLNARTKTIRFKTGLEMAIIEVRALVEADRPDLYSSFVADERNYWAARARALTKAIEDHRTAALSETEDPPLAADEELWAVLESQVAVEV